MHSSNIDIKEINELITYKIKHNYLNKFISKPIIDQTKLTALSVIVNNTSLPEKTKKQYIIATMLIQIALDTHDLIPITNEEIDDEVAVTTKQLTVLAGDYYSGLYYLLLAEIEDIEMISLLATTIKEITEYKMRLYYGEIGDFNECLTTIKKVETLLITRVAKFVNNSMLCDITEKLIITNKLIQEKKYFPNHKNKSPILNDLYTNLKDNSYNSILLLVKEVIQTNISQIEEHLTQPTLQMPTFKTQFQYLLNEIIYHNMSVAEEG